MIQQHALESNKAWTAYLCYQNLGTSRTLSAAYRDYLKALGKSLEKSESANPSASFIKWKSDFHWDDRTREWDASEQERLRDAQRAIDDAQYKSELEEFRESQLEAGKHGVSACRELKFRLLEWLATDPEIKTWKDAIDAARIVAALESASTEQWAKALHIDLMLAGMGDD
jgi:hypothetical protein